MIHDFADDSRKKKKWEDATEWSILSAWSRQKQKTLRSRRKYGNWMNTWMDGCSSWIIPIWIYNIRSHLSRNKCIVDYFDKFVWIYYFHAHNIWGNWSPFGGHAAVHSSFTRSRFIRWPIGGWLVGKNGGGMSATFPLCDWRDFFNPNPNLAAHLKFFRGLDKSAQKNIKFSPQIHKACLIMVMAWKQRNPFPYFLLPPLHSMTISWVSSGTGAWLCIICVGLFCSALFCLLAFLALAFYGLKNRLFGSD